ncbi:CHAT domain-containing protein [Mycena olivaceomarginata]|nr:CHAT domain-containing protein [Mycena olivaceomarginata]
MSTSISPDKNSDSEGGGVSSRDITPQPSGTQEKLITGEQTHYEDVAGDGLSQKPGALFAAAGALRTKTYVPNEAADYFNKAHNLLKEVKAAVTLPSLDKAIYLLQSSAYHWPPDKPGRSECLHRLATASLIRFILTADQDDVVNAISFRGGAEWKVSPGYVDTDPAADPGELMATAVLILRDFFPVSHRSRLDTALMGYREALNTPQKRLEHWIVQWELSEALLIKFHFTRNDEYVDEAILLLRAVQHRKFNRVIGLCAALVTSYGQSRPEEQFSEAAKLCLEIEEKNQEAIELLAKIEPESDEGSLEGAIETWQEVESLLSFGNEQRAMILGGLGNLLESRLARDGDSKDIDDAIQLYREGLVLCASPHPDRSMFLDHLANALDTRYRRCGELADIDEAIGLHRQSIELLPDGHQNRIQSLTHVGIALHRVYERRGSSKDGEEAIRLLREALELGPSPDTSCSTTLISLGSTLRARLWQLRPSPDPGRYIALNNLAGAIHTRYHDQRRQKDINEAVRFYREALQLCEESILNETHLDRSMFLNNLAGAIHARYEQEETRNDIDEAIRLHRESLELRPPPHPLRSSSLHNLAEAVHTRCKRNGDPNDIYETIQLHKDALSLRQSPDPERSTSLSGLADAMETLLRHEKDPTKILTRINQIIALRQDAIAYATTPALARFSESLNWARIANVKSHASRLSAYHSCINLLPQLAAFDLDLKSRREILTRESIVTLASDAAACALSLGRKNVAVEFLETSRSIFWAQALQLRTPLDHLEKEDRLLAEKLRNISRELEQGAFRDTSRNTEHISQREIMSLEAVGDRCRELQKEWIETVRVVQELPGFHDFLRPKDIASLKKAAAYGPVVILLATRLTSLALVVTSSDDVQTVQLPQINQPMVARYAEIIQELSKHSVIDLNGFFEKRTVEDISDSATWPHVKARLYGGRQNRKMVSFDDFLNTLLGVLWTDVVQPVFQFLNIQRSDQPSRLWWCPIGPFAFLPIHAAGIYDKEPADFVSQYVISSYAPTLTALLNVPAHKSTSFNMSVVIQPTAPGCSPLPGTKKELEKIRQHVSSSWLTALPCPTGKEVLGHLPKSSVVHLACHGVQDASDPLNSGLMLSDGRLKISQIMMKDDGEMDSRQRGMSLAFLSACETAKGDKATPDEVMHLAAGLMFSGFHSVVATMWTMQDFDGPEVADGFYEHMFRNCSPESTPPVLPDLTQSGAALHFAVDRLRREPGMSLSRWVPFVHYGV